MRRVKERRMYFETDYLTGLGLPTSVPHNIPDVLVLRVHDSLSSLTVRSIQIQFYPCNVLFRNTYHNA